MNPQKVIESATTLVRRRRRLGQIAAPRWVARSGDSFRFLAFMSEPSSPAIVANRSFHGSSRWPPPAICRFFVLLSSLDYPAWRRTSYFNWHEN